MAVGCVCVGGGGGGVFDRYQASGYMHHFHVEIDALWHVCNVLLKMFYSTFWFTLQPSIVPDELSMN